MGGSKLPLAAPILILYGGYVTLYILCLYIVLSRRRVGYVWQLTTTSILFFLATLSMVSSLITFNDLTLSVHHPVPKWLAIMDVIGPVLSLIVADTILIHRCYRIWGEKKTVIFLPVLLLILTGVTGVLSPLSRVVMALFCSLTLATNLLVTGLSAGRIIWIAKTGSPYLNSELRHNYSMAIALILESGLFYSTTLLVGVIFSALQFSNKQIMKDGFSEAFLLSSQLSGIVPTLLVVWVGLGRTSTNCDSDILDRSYDRTRSPSPTPVKGIASFQPPQSVLDIRVLPSGVSLPDLEKGVGAQ